MKTNHSKIINVKKSFGMLKLIIRTNYGLGRTSLKFNKSSLASLMHHDTHLHHLLLHAYLKANNVAHSKKIPSIGYETLAAFAINNVILIKEYLIGKHMLFRIH